MSLTPPHSPIATSGGRPPPTVGCYFKDKNVYGLSSLEDRRMLSRAFFIDTKMDALVEIPKEKWVEVQERAKKPWPRGAPLYYLLQAQLQHPAMADTLGLRIFCPYGDVSNGVVVLNTKYRRVSPHFGFSFTIASEYGFLRCVGKIMDSVSVFILVYCITNFTSGGPSTIAPDSTAIYRWRIRLHI
ncbi:hypothetical protein EVAR_62354_1 [Eumeta japonica]|uniref:Uncharacterized protein n=1 Tax=Eumeta variegata TaxID=151549 RepID=A0A4C1ZSZ3_EUMVA|nr:hypothetical protein EVAR_62354_1 [Eumeta japonica]